MLKLCVFTLLVLFLCQDVSAARILAVVPSASYSHQMFYQQLWREYAIRGHDIVVITTDPTNETLPNFKEISIKETYVPAKAFIKEMVNSSIIPMILNNRMMDAILDMNEYTLKLSQIQELIHNKTEYFDIVMIEHFYSPILGFQHRFKCPMIGVISIEALSVAHEMMGNSVHKILYPVPLFDLHDSSVFMRAAAVVLQYVFDISPKRSEDKIDRVTKNIFGDDTPQVSELFERTDMLFENTNPLFNAVRPVTPSTISIAGGIHMKPPKPLPKDLQTFLDSAKKGAIYFSLGSNVKSNELTTELRETIMKTLVLLPYKVLWKFEDDSLAGKPDNVHLVKWAPQQDVLRHKNVKLFISQCGMQSLEESLYLHVPLVVMPFMGDQESNALKVQHTGMGLVVDRHKLTVDGFKEAILEVMQNSTYGETVKRLASQIQDTPMTPLDRAIWWTEYVLRHKGAQHLKGPIIPLYQYYYLDVLSVLGLILFVIFGSIFMIGRFCFRKLCNFKMSAGSACKAKKE